MARVSPRGELQSEDSTMSIPSLPSLTRGGWKCGAGWGLLETGLMEPNGRQELPWNRENVMGLWDQTASVDENAMQMCECKCCLQGWSSSMVIP